MPVTKICVRCGNPFTVRNSYASQSRCKVSCRPSITALRQGYIDEGQSTHSLAKQFDVSTSTVFNWLRRAGIERRSFRDATTLMMSRKSPKERLHGVTAATKTLMGKKWSHETLCRRAKTFERNAKLSKHEASLFNALREAGLLPRIAFAIDKFNIDLAFTEIKLAIEVNGGGWHEHLKKAEQRDTTKQAFLEANGWTLIRIKTRRQKWVEIGVTEIMRSLLMLEPYYPLKERSQEFHFDALMPIDSLPQTH